jgi:hypothetical protein
MKERVRAMESPVPTTTMTRSGRLAAMPWDVMLICALTLALRLPSLSLSAIDWDEGVYVVMAQEWIHGGLPYVAVWDQHPLGLPALLALLGQFTSDILLAGRLAAAGAVIATACILAQFCRSVTGQRVPALAAALVYVLSMNRMDALSAQTEVFNNLLVTGASWLLWQAPRDLLEARPRRAAHDHTRDGSAWRIGAAGLAFGVALQVKYVVLPEAALLSGAYLACLLRCGYPGLCARRAALLMAGGLFPTVFAVAAYAAMGHLGAFMQANFAANVAYLGDVPGPALALTRIWDGLRPIGGILVGAAIMFALVARPGARQRPEVRLLAAWIMLWLLAAAIDVALPMKFWRHYFQALIPPLCLATGLAAHLLFHALRGRTWRGANWAVAATLGFLIVAVAPPARGIAIDLAAVQRRNSLDVPRLVASEILRHGTDGHDVYVYNYQPIIYFLTDTRPPTRYVLHSELFTFAESSGAKAWKVVPALLARRPRYIVTAEPADDPFPPGLDALLAANLSTYTPILDIHEPGEHGKRVRLFMRN